MKDALIEERHIGNTQSRILIFYSKIIRHDG